MLARALLVALALEIAGYVMLATFAAANDWSVPALLGTVALIHVGLRTFVVPLGYAIAVGVGGRPAAARLSPVAWLKMLARELLALWRNYVLVPFEPWLPAEPALHGPHAARVVLVHGILCNRASWFRFARGLRARGHGAHAVTLEPVFGSLDAMADRLAATLQGAAGPLVIVGHSMGGLVARRLVQRHPALPVAGIVTLGTPHAGAVQAWLAFGTAGASLRPRSRWLRALAVGGTPASIRRRALWTWHDELVSPPESAQWEGAEPCALAGIGHVDLLWSRRVVHDVADCLDRWFAALAPDPVAAPDGVATPDAVASTPAEPPR